MRKRFSFALAVLVMAALATAPSRAAASLDDPAWLQQRGNGRGSSDPLIPGFRLGTVLFQQKGFTYGNTCIGGTPGACPTWLAWGTVPGTDPLGNHVIQLSMTSADSSGIAWRSPSTATFQDPNGQDVPFVLGSGQTIAIVYVGGANPASGQAPLFIYYQAADGTIHHAESTDGLRWVADTAITQLPAGKLATGASPTQVIYLPQNVNNSFTTCTADVARDPWNCPYVMIYQATTPFGIGIASSMDGSTFASPQNSGQAMPILSPGGAGNWDDGFVGDGHVSVMGGSYVLYFGGGASGGPASIGVAIAADGLHFAESSSNPATPNNLLDPFLPPSAGGSASLVAPQAALDGSDHAKVFFTAQGPGAAETYLASTAAAPADPPGLVVASPVQGYRNDARTPILLYAEDTLGSSVGVDPSSLTIAIVDHSTSMSVPVGPPDEQTTLVNAFKFPASIYSVPGSALQLSDGTYDFTTSIADLNGNVSTSAASFVVDTRPPATTIDTTPSSPVVGSLGGLGRFTGTTADGSSAGTGTPLVRIQGVVTNPLGQTETYAGSATTAGFRVTADSTGKVARWVFNPQDEYGGFYATPGYYTVSVLGVDSAHNLEKPNSQNTVTVLSI